MDVVRCQNTVLGLRFGGFVVIQIGLVILGLVVCCGLDISLFVGLFNLVIWIFGFPGCLILGL